MWRRFCWLEQSHVAVLLPNGSRTLRWPDGQTAFWKVALRASNNFAGPALDCGATRADVSIVDSSGSSKQLPLRRSDRCAVCDRELAVGTQAFWYPASRTVTCLGCSAEEQPVLEGHAGAGALREYDRRHQRREQHARKTLGSFGVLLARIIKEPQSTRSWQQGGRGEVRTGERLAKHLDGCSVRLLHDRRIPRHGNANIDHLAVGPGGVTVIDTKTHRGKVRTNRVGGLFSPRRTVLLIGRRDQTRLIAGVERQIDYVRSALNGIADHVDICGAICFPNADGLPLLGQLAVRDVIIDGPKPIARLTQRPGPLNDELVDRVWHHLGHRFPPA